MKRIGIITMIGNNFGNRLQNYALQEYLKRIGVNVETIYNNIYERPKSIKDILQIPKKIISKIKWILLDKRLDESRNFLFDEFNNSYIKFTKYKILDKEYNYKDLLSNFDIFVVGSDQVWNPYAYRNKDLDFLTFSSKEKNITYAVSFGISNLEKEFEEIYKKGLNNFSYISVREEKGREIIENITNRKDIEVLVDPTMLLTSNDWVKIEKKPKHLSSKKYILNYFLGKISNERKKEIENIAKNNDCEIINILDKEDPYYVSGPSEFLYLERNAFLICTDSFHSCVFAILFGIPFVVFDREDDLVNMNSRIETLLKKFQLEDRRFTGKIKESNLKYDYTQAYKILNSERKKAYNYLYNALKLQGEKES